MAHAYPVVLDWIDRLEELSSVDQAWRSFLSFAGRYGFSHGGIADVPNPKWRMPDNVLTLTWPESWTQRYTAGKFLRRDPSVRALTHTREPFTWAEGLEFDDYPRAERNIVFAAREHGLHSGFVVPITGLRSGTAVLTVAGEDAGLSSRDRAELHFAAIYAQARVRALALKPHRLVKTPSLTPRECECLEWAAMGKTDWEIGEILSIAESTAGAHIERAKAKLGVSTRIQAVVLALQRGAISV